MFNVPYRSVLIEQVLPEPKVGANGVVVGNCPLCGAVASLLIRQAGGNCHCSRCLAGDDILGFYARARQIRISAAVKELFEIGAIDDDPRYFDHYPRERAPFDAVEAVFEMGQSRLRSQEWPSAIALLQANGILVEKGYSLGPLAERVGVIHAEDLQTIGLTQFDDFNRAASWMGKRACLATPISEYRCRPFGLMIVNAFGQYRVARLPEHITGPVKQGTLFLRHVRRGDEACVVVPDLFASWQMVLKLARITDPIAPVIGLYSDDREIRQIKDVDGKRLVFWNPSLIDSFNWSEAHATSLVSTHPWVGQFSALDTPRLVAEVVDNGVERHNAVAYILSTVDDEDAKRILNDLRNSAADLNSVLAATTPAQRARVKALILDQDSNPSVDYRNKTIRVSGDGWVAGTEVISEAVIQLESVYSAGARVFVTGTVLMRGQSYEFQDTLNNVRRGATWVETFLVSKNAPMPYIGKTWRTHLFEIAMQFHKPQTLQADQQLGWNDTAEKLTMPNFSIDQHGVHPVEYVNCDTWSSGAGLAPPPELEPGQLAKSLGDETFWYLFIYTAAQLLQEPLACEVPSMVITGRSNTAWANALKQGLNLSLETTANPQTLSVRERNNILPVLVQPVSPSSFATWVGQSAWHRAIVCLHGEAVPLMNHQGWMVRKVDDMPASYVTDLISQVFRFVIYAIPFLGGLRADVSQRGVFWSIGNCVASWAIRQPDSSRKVIQDAMDALYRDHGVGEMRRDESSRLLILLRELANCGALTVEEDDAQRFFRMNWQQVYEIFGRYGFARPTYVNVRKKLAPYIYEAPANGTELLIKYSDWVLYGAFVR